MECKLFKIKGEVMKKNKWLLPLMSILLVFFLVACKPAETLDVDALLTKAEQQVELLDGTSKKYLWEHDSRANSWTEEMKEEARIKALERNKGGI